MGRAANPRVRPGARFCARFAEGYVFELRGSDFQWSCTASPVDPGKTGDRYFFVDDSGVIRFERDRQATATSPPIGG